MVETVALALLGTLTTIVTAVLAHIIQREKAKSETVAAATAANDAAWRKMNDALDRQAATISKLESDIKEIETRRGQLQDQLTTMKTELETVHRENANLRGQLEALTKRQTELETENQALKSTGTKTNTSTSAKRKR